MVPPCLSFNTGAPQSACQTLAPDATQHRAPPQVSDVPYVLDLSAFDNLAIDQMVYTPDTVYNGIIIIIIAVRFTVHVVPLLMHFQIELVLIFIVVPVCNPLCYDY